MDEYDIDKDFSTVPFGKNNKCYLYGLSELGWKKHIKHKKYLSTIENRFNILKAKEQREKEQYKKYLHQNNSHPDNHISTNKSDITISLGYNSINPNSLMKLNIPSSSPPSLSKCNSQRIIPQCSLSSLNTIPIKFNKPHTRLKRNHSIDYFQNSYSSYHSNTNFCNNSLGKFNRLNATLLKSVLASSNPLYEKEDSKAIKKNEIYEKIINENDRLKMIFLTDKTKRLLVKSYLPSLSNTHRKIIVDVSKNIKGNSNYFGEKYNPCNYELNNPKNRVKRNSFGNLYSK